MALKNPETNTNFPTPVSRGDEGIENDARCLNADQNLVELKLIASSNTLYILKVSAAIRERALNDMNLATKLLENYLLTLDNSTASNKCIERKTADCKEGTSGLYKLMLFDRPNMEEYTLYVDKETYNRAQTDTLFATQLLYNHKTTTETQALHTQSSNIDNNDDDDIVQGNSNEELNQLMELCA